MTCILFTTLESSASAPIEQQEPEFKLKEVIKNLMIINLALGCAKGAMAHDPNF